MRISDRSSDVCPSDLHARDPLRQGEDGARDPQKPLARYRAPRVLLLEKLEGFLERHWLAVDITLNLVTAEVAHQLQLVGGFPALGGDRTVEEIGRESCRERVCQ